MLACACSFGLPVALFIVVAATVVIAIVAFCCSVYHKSEDRNVRPISCLLCLPSEWWGCDELSLLETTFVSLKQKTELSPQEEKTLIDIEARLPDMRDASNSTKPWVSRILDGEPYLGCYYGKYPKLAIVETPSVEIETQYAERKVEPFVSAGFREVTPAQYQTN